MRIQIRLQNLLEHAQLGLFLRFEGARIFQHFAVAIAQNVGRKPARHPQHARLQSRRDQRLHEGLAGLEILAADRNLAIASQLQQRRRIGGQIRRAVGVGHAALQRGIGINLAGRDVRIVLLQAALEILRASDAPLPACETLRWIRTRS